MRLAPSVLRPAAASGTLSRSGVRFIVGDIGVTDALCDRALREVESLDYEPIFRDVYRRRQDRFRRQADVVPVGAAVGEIHVMITEMLAAVYAGWILDEAGWRAIKFSWRSEVEEESQEEGNEVESDKSEVENEDKGSEEGDSHNVQVQPSCAITLVVAAATKRCCCGDAVSNGQQLAAVVGNGQKQQLVAARYYQRQRASDSRSAARTTIRLLESLTRLAQAHARLMCHSEVTVMDAVIAVFVMEVSKSTDNCSDMLEGGVESVLHSNFSDNPEEEYALQEKLVLDYLMLQELSTANDVPSQSQPASFSQQRPDPVSSFPLGAGEYEEAHSNGEFAEDLYIPGTEEQQVPTGKRSWSTSQQQRGENGAFPSQRKQRREDALSQSLPWSQRRGSPASQSVLWGQRRQSFGSASASQQQVEDEDLDIMDDYRRVVQQQSQQPSQQQQSQQPSQQQNQHAEEQPRVPPRPRFNFGRWSQQAEASQSIISKWKK
ncbi:hypothetical protein ON010_g14053 [Phytophthora cinnamomi]|nr:hypothetical protein ON010_g14053 [Phytophthora cinnamomi]